MSTTVTTAVGGYDGNYVGAALVVVASIISGCGANVQKRSHDDEAEKPDSEKQPYILRPLWLLGMAMMLAGALADFFALGLASQALVAAIGGSTSLITNLVVAHLWNGEVLQKTDIAGVFCIVCGVITFGLTIPASHEMTLATLEENFMSPHFGIYLLVQMGIIVVLFAGINHHHHWADSCTRALSSRVPSDAASAPAPRPRSPRDHQPVADSAPLLGVSATADQPEPEEFIKHWQVQYVYAGTAGAIGALGVLFGGCVAKVVVVSLHGPNEFNQVTPLFFVVGAGIFLVVQTHLVNMAMMLGDNMTVIPVFQAFWTVWGVCGGVVFYHEGSVSLLGLVFMLIGVLFLVQHVSKKGALDKSSASPGPAENEEDKTELAEKR